MAVLLGLFFGGIAFGSLHTAVQEYRWRDATEVHGVLVKQGKKVHYEYRQKGKPAVVAAAFDDDRYTSEPDGVVDDWARVEYSPTLPEKLRPHRTRGRPESNYTHFLITLSVGSLLSIVTLICVGQFVRGAVERARRS